MMNIELPTLTCLRCGHRWTPRKTNVAICPTCKSARWQEPKAQASRENGKKGGRPPKQSELETLRWYVNRSNHGRGRVRAELMRMIERGLLRFERTGVYTWVISITDEGRAKVQ